MTFAYVRYFWGQGKGQDYKSLETWSPLDYSMGCVPSVVSPESHRALCSMHGSQVSMVPVSHVGIMWE